jgi:transmembrane sensor
MDNAIHSRYCIAPLLHHRCDPCLAAAVLALVGGGWLGWSHWRSQPLFSEHYATVRGQALQVRLPDGSQMLLDDASQAQVQLFRGRREVRLLEGQALFHASADAQRPFEVRAGHTLVTVLGTRFSVRHTRAGLDAGQTVVEVESGRVRVGASG